MRLRFNVACVAALGVVLLAACSRVSPDNAMSPRNSGEIRDSTTFGLRITGFNGPRTQAKFALAEPAYVVALAVVPGRSVDPVALRMVADTAIRQPGVHEVSIAMPRAPGISTPHAAPGQSEYQRCIAQREVVGRQQQTATTTEYDSTGKQVTRVVATGGSYPSELPSELQCAHLRPEKGAGRRPSQMPHPDRFLLLIASDVRLTQADLLERLSALTVSAQDAPATFAGVADALYADRTATWSGSYTRW